MTHELKYATSCDYSAWIAASAGTGKTRLLTNRIINLLLSRVDPQSILCLTFTKAAKGEMLSRINNVLRSFKSQTDEEIRAFFLENFEKTINNKDLERIRNFYQKYISEGREVAIYTIHAFCQSLLQKFPLEAGLKPYFRVIDETSASRFIAKTLLSQKTTIYIDEVLQNNLSLYSLKEITEELAHYYSGLDLSENSIEAVDILLKSELGARSTQEIEMLRQKLYQIIQENQGILRQFRELNLLYSENLPSNFDLIFINLDVRSFFLTKTSQKRKKIIPKKDLQNLLTRTEEVLYKIQEYIYEISSAQDLNNALAINVSVLRLANFIFSEYKNYKEINNLLDYQDLIHYAYNLLCNSDIKEWIKYKLDGGINHILVDESQDTSQEQWNIIISLLEDFFANEVNANSNLQKTIFVVGDVKQSIYSFQGARPDLFLEAKNYIKNKALESKANFVECNLEKTYRLPKLIFNFVYNIFSKVDLIEQVRMLECSNQDVNASVTIWPLVKSTEKEDLFWPNPSKLKELQSIRAAENNESSEYFTQENPKQILAKKTAIYIKKLLDDKIYLDSKKRCVRPEDIMILVQKRSSLNFELYKEILKQNINISGLDRLYLSKSLVVRDLISVAKFIIDPADNLNLACLLKSHLFDMGDEDIYYLKSQKNWYKSIIASDSIISKKLKSIELIYENSDKSEFFLNIIQSFHILNRLREDEEQLDALKAFLHEIRMIFTEDPSLGINDIILLLEIADISVKRDFSHLDSIKITTIHGAKGLEAPIVILIDSNDLNIYSKCNIIHMNLGAGLVPVLSSKVRHEKIDAIKENVIQENYQEYLRLLYVALTRTQDHLIIAGIESKKENKYKSWYELCLENNLSDLEHQEDGSFSLLKYFKESHKMGENIETQNTEDVITPLKDDGNEIVSINPNSLNAKYDNCAEKVFYDFNNKSTIIGEILHKALEIYMQTGQNFTQILTDKFLKNLSAEDRISVRNILFQCEQNEFLNYLGRFNNEAELEIAISDDTGDGFQIKRLDFVSFNKDANEINIVDYKSDGDREKKADYEVQMNEYKQALEIIYPDSNVRIYIYWLRDNQFEELKV
ncbi:MAG: UvrD-helicase domain-containing protein [Rickettsiaceae bacterium]|nr:UvrD-helicase domain-containing protein [Rickettsiaceae bacterium]